MEAVQLEGVRELVAKLNAAPRQVRQAAQEGVNRFAEHVRVEAIKVTPRKTGTLRRSARTEEDRRWWHRDTAAAKISFGGAAAGYAVYVHEAPVKWNWTVPGTGPKYLENTVKRLGTPQGVNQHLVPPIKAALERICRGVA